MKLFLVNDQEAAQACRQLIRLNSDCSRLQWSRSIKGIPEDVLDALETVQDFSGRKLEEICSSAVKKTELTEEQEQILLSAFKKSKDLKKIVGSGVVLAGEEAKAVQTELCAVPELQIITDMLKLGKHLVLL